MSCEGAYFYHNGYSETYREVTAMRDHVLKDHCDSDIISGRSYILTKSNLSPETTCLQRPHFDGQQGGLSRQVLLYVQKLVLALYLSRCTIFFQNFSGCNNTGALYQLLAYSVHFSSMMFSGCAFMYRRFYCVTMATSDTVV